ncbi:hypothetical protein PanWU01x14_343080 [Parasponia andersonii]|uniref:RNase H type-1 domain-containing protein n=1 Tax=Parasponia andersonii TaxID=3476 RepID=A0A2P5ADI2_PARAD|nr:hypothetical protein PanWU01x14_343080 [Parasponia andersonii]
MPGALKLNMDAAVDHDMGFIGIGGRLIRDCVGAGLGTFTTRICGRFNASVAECITVREGLRFAREEGFMVNMVESESLNIITAIRSRSSLGVESSIINGIFDTFSWLDNVSCSHILRIGNEAVNSLVRFARIFSSTMVWEDEILNVSLIFYLMIYQWINSASYFHSKNLLS